MESRVVMIRNQKDGEVIFQHASLFTESGLTAVVKAERSNFVDRIGALPGLLWPDRTGQGR